MMNTKRSLSLPFATVVLVLAAGVGGYTIRAARADGVPAVGALTYSGTLEDVAGKAISGSKPIGVAVYDMQAGGAKVCEAPVALVGVTNGRFDVPLPDTCAAAAKANPNLWIEVTVETEPLGRTKLGAVPYALEAGAASQAKGELQKSVLLPPKIFTWSLVSPVSGVETDAAEGTQTITFSQTGHYRVTLNFQAILDTSPNEAGAATWYLGGNATRLDPFSQEQGGKIYVNNIVGRRIDSTVLFVNATAGQTLTVRPAFSATYTSGSLHQATFGFGSEYIGP